MDLFQRAAELLERAQNRMSDATNQGARIVVNSAQLRALEARQGELRRRIEFTALELGKLTFRHWKSGNRGEDPAMTSLCEQLDRLNAEYQYVVGTLMDARSGQMPYGPAGGQSLPPYPPNPAPGYPSSQPAYSPAPLLNAPYQGSNYPPPPAPPVWTPPVTAAPARPAKPARECPECYTLVPGNADFCQTCGMRV